MKFKTRLLATILAAVGLAAGVSGCAGSYRSISSTITGCAPHEIVISKAWYGYNRMWTASCRNRTWDCRCQKSRCECNPVPHLSPPPAR